MKTHTNSQLPKQLKKVWEKPIIYLLDYGSVNGGNLSGVHEKTASSQGKTPGNFNYKVKRAASVGPTSYTVFAHRLADYNS